MSLVLFSCFGVFWVVFSRPCMSCHCYSLCPSFVCCWQMLASFSVHLWWWASKSAEEWKLWIFISYEFLLCSVWTAQNPLFFFLPGLEKSKKKSLMQNWIPLKFLSLIFIIFTNCQTTQKEWLNQHCVKSIRNGKSSMIFSCKEGMPFQYLPSTK